MPGPAATFAPLLPSGAIVGFFGLTVLGFASAFTIVAYLGPIIDRLTGVTGAGVSALQAFIGVRSFLGLAVGGIAANRKVVRLDSMAAFALMAFDLGAYSWTLSLPPKAVVQPVVAGLILVLASTMFAAIPMNLAQLTQLARPATPLALARIAGFARARALVPSGEARSTIMPVWYGWDAVARYWRSAASSWRPRSGQMPGK
jgi:MFS transporter, DHA1 family, inner membrane transport protein